MGDSLPDKKSLQVGVVQFCHRAGDKRSNLDTIAQFVGRAKRQGVKLLAFPEMCITGYWHVRDLSPGQIDALAEPVPDGPSTTELRQLAAEHGLLIGAGLIERDGEGQFYNSYVCCLPDGEVHVHRKLHCFINRHFSSGNRFTVFPTPWGVNVGVLICWDNNLVENVRATALLGADVLFAPHQTGGCASRSPHAMGRIDPAVWQRRHEDPLAIESEFRGPKGREWLMRWLPSRAHDNGLFLLFSNGVGQDDDEVRTGNAMVLDCYGRVLNETWAAADQLVTATLDLELQPTCTGRRWLSGRRPELYDVLTRRSGRERTPRQVRFDEPS